MPTGSAGSKRNSAEMYPLSPTGYVQPPTPDHPPPSPMTAGIFIQETINPHVSTGPVEQIHSSSHRLFCSVRRVMAAPNNDEILKSFGYLSGSAFLYR